MSVSLHQKVIFYQITTVIGVIFSLIGFSYNVWRMEVTEENNNIRTACFEILIELSALEQLVYAAHYDHNESEGSPRKGWVKVGLIVDLSVLTAPAVEVGAANLKKTWSQNWSIYAEQESAVVHIVESIDKLRTEIKDVLRSLE